jgi:hypothetical protein
MRVCTKSPLCRFIPFRRNARFCRETRLKPTLFNDKTAGVDDKPAYQPMRLAEQTLTLFSLS